jgi:hypothetical protein
MLRQQRHAEHLDGRVIVGLLPQHGSQRRFGLGAVGTVTLDTALAHQHVREVDGRLDVIGVRGQPPARCRHRLRHAGRRRGPAWIEALDRRRLRAGPHDGRERTNHDDGRQHCDACAGRVEHVS